LPRIRRRSPPIASFGIITNIEKTARQSEFFSSLLVRLAETFGRDVGQGLAGRSRRYGWRCAVKRVLHWAKRSLMSHLAGYYWLANQVVLKRKAED
jgi:hypothetical protein